MLENKVEQKAENSCCIRSLLRAGLTLAEVLITLGIIGVVAAMTIPTLVQNSRNQELQTGLKKSLFCFVSSYSTGYC